MNNQETDNYVDIDEIAKYIGVKPSTIRTWIKKLQFPYYRIGGKLLKFKRSEVDNWIKDREKK